MSRGRRLRLLLDLVEEVVTGLAERDELERRREELARAWAERAATLDPDATVLVAPAPVRRLGQLSYAIVAHERRPPADLPDADLDDWWDCSYRLLLELYVAEPMTATYERAGELVAEPWDNAPGEQRGLRLEAVAVVDRLHDRGLGGRLVRELIARARLRGVDSITGAVSPRSRVPDAHERLLTFYRRLGFQVEAEGRRVRLVLVEGE